MLKKCSFPCSNNSTCSDRLTEPGIAGTYKPGIRNFVVVAVWFVLLLLPANAQDKLRFANVYTPGKPPQWTVWIDSPSSVLERIDCVEYTLHPSIANPLRRLCGSSQADRHFALSDQSWGEFDIYISVLWKGKADASRYTYHLDLKDSSKILPPPGFTKLADDSSLAHALNYCNPDSFPANMYSIEVARPRDILSSHHSHLQFSSDNKVVVDSVTIVVCDRNGAKTYEQSVKSDSPKSSKQHDIEINNELIADSRHHLEHHSVFRVIAHTDQEAKNHSIDFR